MNWQEYWKQQDTPMENSPMGKTMQRIHELDPELSIEACFKRARQLLDRAAGSKHYIISILSLEKEAAKLESFRDRMSRRPK